MLVDFTYDKKLFNVAAQTARCLIGVSTVDDCCNAVVLLDKSGIAAKFNVPKGARTYNFIARQAAQSCFTDGDPFMQKQLLPYNSENFAGSINVTPIMPTTVPGTDVTSKYIIVVHTSKGYVARRDGDGMMSPRIRVAKDPAILWPDGAYYLNEFGVTWEAKKADHLGCTGGNTERTGILIARGVEILLKLGKSL